jgi:gp16 family phage-associated protein
MDNMIAENQTETMEVKSVTTKIRAKGFTVSGWAKARGFARMSVYEAIRGGMQGRKGDSIRNALQTEGFM